MDVSFLLPTNRANTHAEVLQECIQSINSIHTDVSYEILVYSEDLVEGESVKWIEEHGRTGPIAGFNYMASEVAQGDYVVCITDDHAFTSSVSLCIDVVEDPVIGNSWGARFDERSYKIIGLNPGGNYCTQAGNRIPQRGDILGDEPIDFDVPEANTLRFPVVRRDTLEEKLSSHIFHPDLFYHAGDIWLGYFLFCEGEQAFEGPTGIREIASLKDPSYEARDCNVVHSLIKNHIAGCTDYLPSHY